MTHELPPSFPWSTDEAMHDVFYFDDGGTRMPIADDDTDRWFGPHWATDYHHAWSAFCVQWIAVGVSALVGRP